ncbi:hypothetical protein [Amycolatopsis sacchari]|uniref:hypothetical protein n=1 Tax=Amycolatopsis sacchari TaxID=115433 RepID=UPI003D73E6F0
MIVEPNRPFRWNLVRPDRLGTLLDGAREPDLWFLDELVACMAKVVARCGDGELHFVGRSLDSGYDLLSGILSGTTWLERLHQLPLSLNGFEALFGELGHTEVAQLRANLGEAGLAPADLARGRRPVVFVDIVSSGRTFEKLHRHLRSWADEERAAWNVIRRGLRFLGVTCRQRTSPKTWRWQQHAPWTDGLPARSIRNVSLDPGVFSYFANRQHKLTPSFARWFWADHRVRVPDHDPVTLETLAEAVAVVEAGRAAGTRNEFVRHLVREPAMAQPWLRDLVHRLR